MDPQGSSLTQQRTLDHETLWQYMRQLLERVARVFERDDDVIDECLDIVVDLLGADRGVVLMSCADGTFHVINARSGRRALSTAEREEISRTIVRESLESGRCIILDHRSDLASAAARGASITSFGIRAALAAPLQRRANELGGVLYVDFRRVDRFVDAAHVEFF